MSSTNDSETGGSDCEAGNSSSQAPRNTHGFAAAANFVALCDFSMNKRRRVTADTGNEENNNIVPESDIASDIPPFDIFLVHTGQQKFTEVSTLKEFLLQQQFQPQTMTDDNTRSGSYRCFVDSDMQNSNGSPNSQMEYALETCRHAVVLVSRAFLSRRCPCAELLYSFRRMLWLREKYASWQSLWIVLVDISIQEYESTRVETGNRLPPIAKEVQLFQRKNFRTWVELCYELIGQITDHDCKYALSQWKLFLNDRSLLRKMRTFPRANGLYEMPRQETGCKGSGKQGIEDSLTFSSDNIMDKSATSGFWRTAQIYSQLSKRAVDAVAKVPARSLKGANSLFTGFMDYYCYASTVRNILSFTMTKESVFVLGFDGVPEEIAGYFDEETYLATFSCWIVDRFLETHPDCYHAIRFIETCFDPCPRQLNPDGETIDNSFPDIPERESVEIVATGGVGGYVVFRRRDFGYWAIYPDGRLRSPERGDIPCSRHQIETMQIDFGCLTENALRAFLSCSSWSRALLFLHTYSAAVHELGSALKSVEKMRLAPTRRRLQDLANSQGARKHPKLGILTTGALEGAKRRFLARVASSTAGNQRNGSGLFSATMKGKCIEEYRPVTIQNLKSRLDDEVACGREDAVRWRWYDGVGGGNATILAAFVSRILNDISATESLDLANVNAGFKVVKADSGAIMTWPDAGGVIVDMSGNDNVAKQRLLADGHAFKSILAQEEFIPQPIVAAALIKAFALECPEKICAGDIVRILEDSPGLLYQPVELLSKGILGDRVSIGKIHEACHTLVGNGRICRGDCCLRLCLQALVSGNCLVEGSVGTDFVKALQRVLCTSVPRLRSTITLLCNFSVTTNGMSLIGDSDDAECLSEHLVYSSDMVFLSKSPVSEGKRSLVAIPEVAPKDPLPAEVMLHWSSNPCNLDDPPQNLLELSRRNEV